MVNEDLKALFRYAWPYRWALTLASILMLLQSVTSLSLPWLAGQLTGSLAGSGSGAVLPIDWVFAAFIAAFSVQTGLGVGSGYVLAQTANRAVGDLRIRLHDHLQSLPVAYYHDRSKGDALALLTNDLDVVSGFISGTLVAVVPSLLTFAGALAMMLRIDWRLSVAVLLAVSALFLVVLLMGRRIRPLSAELAEANARAIAAAEDTLTLLPLIKAFTRERDTSRRYAEHTRHAQDLTVRHQAGLLRLGPLMELAGTAGFVVLLWLATRNVLIGTLTPTELVTFVMCGVILTRPLGRLATIYGETQHARSVMARLQRVLEAAPEPGASGRHVRRVKGHIEFRDVWFGYPGRARIFEGLNLRIAPGETVAVTGVNGSGKSTLINLLLRFVVPERGRILIDGSDIATLSLESLRSQVGLVPQSLLLPGGTVRENIAFGRPDASLEVIETAARTACAHDFIAQLPDGYETIVGEKGGKLSGGQQQRIALARALLKNPPILILDEATAMFDPAGEEEFLALAKHLVRNRTLLLITHRPAGLRLAHRVLRLNASRLCQVDG